jgi:uncharacterized protein (DUF305 family)
MNTRIILVAVIALLLGGIGGYALNSQNYEHEHDDLAVTTTDDSRNETMMGMHRMPDGSMMSNDGEMSSMDGMSRMNDMNEMDHMMGMMVKSEREFIAGMIPHHQEAIDTASEVLARGGTTPEIRTLAENIITAQQNEIAEMKQWHIDWYGESYVSNGEYVPMMRNLSQLSGEVLDRTFLEDMVMHHMGAIMMAQSVKPHIEHTEIEKLTEAIVRTQSQEIQLMQQLLTGL